MSRENRPPEFGIRWVPTILGTLLIVTGIVLFASGLAAPSKSSVELMLSVAFVIVGIALIRFGRRGITRPLRSIDRMKS